MEVNGWEGELVVGGWKEECSPSEEEGDVEEMEVKLKRWNGCTRDLMLL